MSDNPALTVRYFSAQVIAVSVEKIDEHEEEHINTQQRGRDPVPDART
jgi:hypothetical protein